MYWNLDTYFQSSENRQANQYYIFFASMPILIPNLFSQSLDPEGKGKIGVDQFLSMMEERLVISDWNEKDEERLFIKAFETLDPENTGKIPAAALR